MHDLFIQFTAPLENVLSIHTYAYCWIAIHPLINHLCTWCSRHIHTHIQNCVLIYFFFMCTNNLHLYTAFITFSFNLHTLLPVHYHFVWCCVPSFTTNLTVFRYQYPVVRLHAHLLNFLPCSYYIQIPSPFIKTWHNIFDLEFVHLPI